MKICFNKHQLCLKQNSNYSIDPIFIHPINLLLHHFFIKNYLFICYAGSTYFFKGKYYWKFNNDWIIVDESSPLPSPQTWLGCPKEISD